MKRFGASLSRLLGSMPYSRSNSHRPPKYSTVSNAGPCRIQNLGDDDQPTTSAGRNAIM
jgi:hypothetical protein